MNDTYGPMYETPLARWDRPTSSWRTCAATSLWDLPMSSLTLPNWGCLRDGELYELPTPAPATVEQGCSSLPTPNARDYKGSQSAAWSTQASLPRAIKELPTPRAGHERNQTISQREGPQNLENALALLPTPAVNDMGAGKEPQAWEEWSARQKAADGRPAPHGKSLEQEALRMIGTPTARMTHRSKRGMGKEPNPRELAAMVSKGIRPGEPTSLLFTDGQTPLADPLQPLPFTEPIGTA
jgi:hypothetical protein